MTPPRPALALAPGEQDQVLRLWWFRKARPHIVIGQLGWGGPWQALIPEDNGETVIIRRELRDLLDRLGELLSGREEEL